MKKVHVIGAVVLGVSLVSGLAFASGSMKTKNTESSAKTAVSNEVGNKICPVSGQPVGTMGEVVKYEHNGKIYNLCCPACKKDFVKNPEKYSKAAEESVS